MTEAAMLEAVESLTASIRALEQDVALRDACIDSLFRILQVTSRDDAEELCERLRKVVQAHGGDGTTWETEYAGLLDAWARMHPFFKVTHTSEQPSGKDA